MLHAALFQLEPAACSGIADVTSLLTNSCDDIREPHSPQTLFFFNDLSENVQQECVAGKMGPGCMAKAASDELPPIQQACFAQKLLYDWQVCSVHEAIEMSCPTTLGQCGLGTVCVFEASAACDPIQIL